MNRVHDVLWTSGWDSTYRVASLLLQHGRTVQPWYVEDPGRRSTRVELATLGRLRDALVRHEPAAAHLLRPVRRRVLRDVAPDPETSGRYRRLAARSHLGIQYDWLARLVRQEQLQGLELCIHRDDAAHAFVEGAVVRADEPPPDDSWHLLEHPADDDLRLFSGFSFPVLETTKLQMAEDAGARGWGDVMEMTWFCHSPTLRGRPCGVCAPCRYTREEGLGRRIPERGPLGRLGVRGWRKATGALNRLHR